MAHTIALIGGTGPEGRGLATRFALAGHRVLVGSRDPARGEQAAREVAERLGEVTPGVTGTIEGGDNQRAATEAEIAVVVVPYTAHRATLEGLREPLAGKIIVDAVVPVVFDRGPRPVEVEAGSATEEARDLLPDSRVVGAFHNLAADVLVDPERAVEADVLVTGDREAKQTVIALAGEIEGVRGVDAGPLRFSRFVEGITVLLIGINGRYKTHSGVRVSGLEHSASGQQE